MLRQAQHERIILILSCWLKNEGDSGNCLLFLTVMIDEGQRLVPAQKSIEHLGEWQHLVPASLGSASLAECFERFLDLVGGSQHCRDWVNGQAESEFFEITDWQKRGFASLDHIDQQRRSFRKASAHLLHLLYRLERLEE